MVILEEGLTQDFNPGGREDQAQKDYYKKKGIVLFVQKV